MSFNLVELIELKCLVIMKINKLKTILPVDYDSAFYECTIDRITYFDELLKKIDLQIIEKGSF